jgi:lipopolysaccharide transport protein LptA
MIRAAEGTLRLAVERALHVAVGRALRVAVGRGARLGLVAALLTGVAGPAWSASSVGVAPFERGGSGTPPDVATLLADRLTTAGVACTGPDRIGVPAVAEPEAAQVKTWAAGSGVDAIVFGRVTGIGSRFSVDVQLRSTATGEVVSVHVVEIDRAGAVDAAVAELTRKVLEGLTVLEAGTPASKAGARAAAGSPAPPVAARPPAPKAKNDGGLFGSGGGAPLRITSDDLEARQSGGARHMIFTTNVKAERADMVLTANRLDAFYPKGSSRPDRLVATGNVVMNRDGGEAHCKKMTYLQSDGRIHCEGDAELVRAGDRAKGDKIEWDLETDTIFIKGNADVLLIDEEAGAGS